MIRVRGFLILLLGAFLLMPASAQAVPSERVPVSARQHSALMPAAAEIGQQIQALVTGEEGGEIEPQETFGTRALGVLLSTFNILRQEGIGFITDFAALPQLGNWLGQQISDKNLSARWSVIGQRLILVFGGAFLAGVLASFVLLPLRRRIRRHTPSTLWGRFYTLVVWFLVSLLPVIVFVATSIALMDPSEQTKIVRFFVMTVIYAFAIFRIIRLVARIFLAPKTQTLRLLSISDDQARYAYRWISIFSGVMVFGYFGGDLGRFARMPDGVIVAFNNIIGLTVVLMTIMVIVQKRSVVSSFLRGDLSAARVNISLWEGLRLWLARVWHVLAISYLVIGYLVTAFSQGGGFQIMQRGTILTLLALLGMRLCFHLIARLEAKQQKEHVAASSGIYKPVLQILLRISTGVLGAAGILAAWGADVSGFVNSAWGQRILGSVFSITSTIVIVVLIYETMHSAVERRLNQRDSEGNVLAVNPRAQTLLPMLRNAAILILAVIVGIVTLSEFGINIGPLLAGAGVLGVAIGFGSQTLVKDFLTGLFIILEDTISVGDVVKIGDNSGVVESITIRTARLRDLNGSLHVLPFSEITKIVNLTKGFSYAVIDMGVAYDSNLEKVMQVMEDIGAGLKEDPVYKDFILEPLEMLGVESLGDFSITIRCRIKTRPGQQWTIKRAYLLRAKERFDAEKIEIPFPTSMQLYKKKTL